jgi:hypothetical protein
VRFVSAFDQPITIEGFRGDERFDVGYGTEYTVRGEYEDGLGRTVRDVKSIQMNREAFEFAGLDAVDGARVDWGAVDYDTGALPVLLGADLADSYVPGDRISGSFLFRDVVLEVVGFLEPASTMYFRGELNRNLDDTILVPYPPSLANADLESEFLGMLGFQMLNGDVVVERHSGGDRTNDLLAQLDALADGTGFHDWSLTGVPTYVVQMSLVRQILVDNVVLVVAILVLLAVAVAVLWVFLGAVLLRRRTGVAHAYRTVGVDERTIARMTLPTTLLEVGLALTTFLVACSLLPNRNGVVAALTACLVLAWIAVDGLVQRRASTRAGRHHRRERP